MQKIIKKQQLSYFGSQTPTQLCFFNRQNKMQLTLLDSSKIIQFTLPKDTFKDQDVQPKSTVTINLNYPLITAFSINNCLFLLQANRQLIIQSNSKKQTLQEIWGILPLNSIQPIVMMLQWNTDQQICKLKFMSVESQIKKITFTQFPAPKHVHLFTQNCIITDQYLIDIRIPTNWKLQQSSLDNLVKMVPNPAYDGILDKVFIGIDLNYIVYEIEDAVYFQRYFPSTLKHVIPLNSKAGISISKGIIFSCLEIYVVIQSNNKQKLKVSELAFYSLQHGIKLLSFPIEGKYCSLLNPHDNTNICVMDLQKLQINWINVLELIKPHQFQQKIKQLMSQKYHLNILKTMEYREKQLLGMKVYAQKGDFESALRIITNQQNISIVVDGIKMIYNTVKTNLSNQLANSIALICKQIIQKSKYQSHLQQALLILLQLTDTANKKNLQNIAETKRIQKLIKQDKKIRLFQLSFEFVQKVKPII